MGAHTGVSDDDLLDVKRSLESEIEKLELRTDRALAALNAKINSGSNVTVHPSLQLNEMRAELNELRSTVLKVCKVVSRMQLTVEELSLS